ncbi:MAG: VCBS repeat-containing protein [Acidobacteria bacterium]|nr:VCBS repeat-containing protein [Acidobacteriota bacterium]MCA1639929.1 VCBS repeat-containing protein [Acidobacteriota bacterium]
MNQVFTKRKKLHAFCLALLLALGAAHFAGVGSLTVEADTNAQPLPFSQNWSNVNLITTDDNWSGVPGIIGYRGDDLTTLTGADPRTILADGSGVIDVIANQTNPDTLSTGGVAEFEITNPTIALQGSGTADAPHIVIRVNTTGQSNIVFAANIRDIDASADDAVQQVDVQYRVGGSGNYTSVPGGYIADATTAGSATQVTTLNLTLPAAANNQAIVDIRVITTNAAGNDEWIGIDDIRVTAGGSPQPTPEKRAPFDFTGDGRSDWATYGNLFAAEDTPLRWKVTGNPASPGPNQAFQRAFDYGFNTDVPVPADYIGDRKTDVVVWREGTPGIFFVAQFPFGTGGITLDRVIRFGADTDAPREGGDYDGDGKADYTVIRINQTNGNLTWFIKNSATGVERAVNFGTVAGISEFQVFPGADFTGDGRDEIVFAIANNTTGNNTYFVGDAITGVGVLTRTFGNFNTDNALPPADYTGDGRADFVSVNLALGSQAVWFINNSATNAITATPFGIGGLNFNTIDLPVRGDYDGDGRHDIAVYRRSNQTFYYLRSSSNNLVIDGQKHGDPGDFPMGAVGSF